MEITICYSAQYYANARDEYIADLKKGIWNWAFKRILPVILFLLIIVIIPSFFTNSNAWFATQFVGFIFLVFLLSYFLIILTIRFRKGIRQYDKTLSKSAADKISITDKALFYEGKLGSLNYEWHLFDSGWLLDDAIELITKSGRSFELPFKLMTKEDKNALVGFIQKVISDFVVISDYNHETRYNNA